VKFRFDERRGQVVIEHVQFFRQRLDRHAAAVAHRVRLGFIRAGPLDFLRPHHGLRVVAGLLREQILPTGVKRAESARAAHRRPLIVIIGAGPAEGQRAHDLMRLDGVTEQKSRAILGAVTALVARGFADPWPVPCPA